MTNTITTEPGVIGGNATGANQPTLLANSFSQIVIEKFFINNGDDLASQTLAFLQLAKSAGQDAKTQ